MKQVAVVFLTALALGLGAIPALAAGWAWTFQAGPGYPAARIPSHREGFDKRDSEWQGGAAGDYRLNDSWSLGLDVEAIRFHYAAWQLNRMNRFQIVTGNVHTTYVMLPRRRFTPVGRLGIGGGTVREEWTARFSGGDPGMCCFYPLSYQSENALEGDLGLGLGYQLASGPPYLRVALLGDYHVLSVPNYRPGVSSLSYLGVSLGLTFSTRGPS